jgi:hypothetical protein
LRQIVPDAALNDSVLIFARKFVGVGSGFRMRCTVGITFQGYRGNCDDRAFGKPLFQVAILRYSFSDKKHWPSQEGDAERFWLILIASH